MLKTKAVRRYGPKQLRDALGLTEWQFGRARVRGDVPGPDLDGGKWSAGVVDVLVRKAEKIRGRAGKIPDCGALAAASLLTGRLEMDVTADTVVELARRGRLRVVGDYKGHPLYDGRQLETFRDVAAVKDAAGPGRQMGREEVGYMLRVRDSDVQYLLTSGWLTPVAWARTPFTPRSARADVPIFRAGDVQDLLDDPGIDWAAVRAVKPGGRSLLAALPARPPQSGRDGRR